MGTRFFCFLHRKPMTDTRRGHCGAIVHRCEDCVRDARAKVRAKVAAYEASKQRIRECGRAT